MKKINVLEINNIDLPGRTFNGYNMISDLSNNFSIRQMVLVKQSNNSKVTKLLDNDKLNYIFNQYKDLEDKLSIHNLLSITTPALKNSEEYKKADILHFHMFHNTKLSIPSIIDISKEKHVIISLHDPWFFTGRCVHFYDCDRWINGCNKCCDLNTLFPFKKDNCANMWEIKKEVFNNSNIDIVVPSKWMLDNVRKSKIFSINQRLHLIPFGINLNKYNNNYNKKEIRKKLGISQKSVVLFLRAQKEFKGTEYIVKALKKLNLENKITILTCQEEGLFEELKNKYKIIELGNITEKLVIEAMNACDIFLMPSKAESFGMMAIEAMACSRPVIIFNNTALPSVTFAPKCGYLVENRNADKLAEAIEKLVNNPEERVIRGELGRKYCEENYSYDKYNKLLEDLYNGVIKNKLIKKYNNKKVDEEEYEKYLNSVKKYLENQTIDFSIDYFNPKNINIINKVNDTIYEEIVKKESNIKIPVKSKIKLLLRKSKLLRYVYHKLKRM